jgi:hypothetical protein
MLCDTARSPAFAQACRSAAEDDRAAAQRRETPRRLAADEKPAKTADPPEFLEIARRHLAEVDAPVVAGIVDDEVDGKPPFARRHRPIEQPHDIALLGDIGLHRLGAAAARDKLGGDRLDLMRRPPGDQHVVALRREAPAQRAAQSFFGADPAHHGGRQSVFVLRRHRRLRRQEDQCASAGGALGGTTLRSRGTSSVAITKATMIARKASAKARVDASR